MTIRMSLIAATFVAAFSSQAVAQSPEYMREHCANATQSFFQNFDAQIETKYEGQRTDGTHAINGTLYLERGLKTFQCSYNRDGSDMVGFFADNKSWPGFAKYGDPSPYQKRASGTSAAPSSGKSQGNRSSASGEKGADVGIRGLALGGKMRSGPGTRFRALASVPPNTRLTILGDTGVRFDGYKWFEVVLDSNRRGFIWGGILCSEGRRLDGVLQACGRRR